ncbi:Zn-dependent protease [Clostridioides difficile]|nr:Zn-dependent protease [Clostridioides difficile]
MIKMNIIEIRSDKVYKKIMNAPVNKKEDIYRYELMKPFEFKWKCIDVPMVAKQEGGYDVIMASEMMGVLSPKNINENQINNINAISDDKLWNTCKETIENSMNSFIREGYNLNIKDYKYSILLANPNSPYTILSDGCWGDGGIPGYMFISLVPNEYMLNRLQVALAHECNHNIRFQFINWSNDITLEEMMINEGLAENFATWMFGEDMVGPWVSKTDIQTLDTYVKPIIKNALKETGFQNITSYLYGDDIAKMQGYFPVGLPYCAGYACGYYMIKYYLEKTNKSIVEATLLPYTEIIEGMKAFWK